MLAQEDIKETSVSSEVMFLAWAWCLVTMLNLL